MNKKHLYYLSLLMAQVLVGINIVASKTVVDDFSIFGVLFGRFFVATVVLYGIHCFTSMSRQGDKKNRVKLSHLTARDWCYMTAQGLCGGALFNIMLLWGLNYTSAGSAGIITSMLPAIIVVFSVIFLKERLTAFSTACVCFAVIGLFIINMKNFSVNNMSMLWGDFLIFLALIPEAVYYILARKYVSSLPLFLTATIMNAVNLPFSLLCLVLSHSHTFSGVNLHAWLILIIIGLATGFFYVFWFYGCRFVKGSVAGLITAAMPLSTLLLASIFLDETIGPFQLLGMIMVIVSIIFSAKKS